MRASWSRRSSRSGVEPPIELRFVDLFMILMTTLIFIAVILSIISAAIPGQHPEPSSHPRVLTRSLPDALHNQPYQVALAAAGGTGAYSWELASGRLPAGLRLGPDGSIAGTPRKLGRTLCRFRVRDGDKDQVSTGLAFTVRPAAVLSPSIRETLRFKASQIMLPRATYFSRYQTKLAVEGGVPPYAWRLVKGELPPGLDWSSRGVLRGRPRGAGKDYSFSMEVADSKKRRRTQEYTMVVAPALWQKVMGWIGLAAIAWMYWQGGPGLRLLWERWKARRLYR